MLVTAVTIQGTVDTVLLNLIAILCFNYDE